MDKRDLRNIGLRNLAWLSKHPSIKKNKEQNLCKQLFETDCWKKSNSVAITKSMLNEFNTERLLTTGLAANKMMLMPKVQSKHKMTFHKVTGETAYQRTTFGVEEPITDNVVSGTEIDLVIVPGIIFKTNGYRIGFGGGYYDHFLKDFKGISCSLVFSEQIHEQWQPETFDLPVQQLFIT